MSYPPPGGYQGGGYPPPPGPPSGKTKVLGLDNNVAAMLCYLPACLCCIDLISSILWLATEPKENRFLRFHSLQGLMLFFVGLVINIVGRFLGVGISLSGRMAGGAGELGAAGASLLLFFVFLAIGLIFLIIHIIACVKAYQGQMWKLPIIGDIAEKNS